MDEQDLRERLLSAAAVPPPEPSTISLDLARGQRGRRRRTIAVAGGSLAVVAVLGTVTAAVGLSAQSNGADRLEQGGFAHAGQGTSQTPTSSAETASTTGRILTASEVSAAISSVNGVPDELAPWKDELVNLAYNHLDPDHRYIPDPKSEYNGCCGVSIGADDHEYEYYIGMTLNWTDNDPSQGRVDVALAPAGVDGLLGCGDFAPCQLVDDPTYGEIQLGGDPTGTKGFEVIVTRPDGVVVRVTVSPIGRGPIYVPSQAPLPSLDQVLAFATDPALGLPTG